MKGKYADRNWFAPIESHVFPVLGNLLMNEIVGRDVVDVMNAVDAKGLKVAPKLRVNIAMIFNAALASGDRPLAMGNPADAKLIAAMRPGRYALDDEHYPRVALVDAPLAIAALCKARHDISDALMSNTSTSLWRQPSTCGWSWPLAH